MNNIFKNMRNFHYYSSNFLLRTKYKNNLGLNSYLYGFKLNNNNNIDLVNRTDLLVLNDRFKVKTNFNKIIEINNSELILPPNQFKWFFETHFRLQFYNDYQRDIDCRLFMIEPSKKNIIKNILYIG